MKRFIISLAAAMTAIFAMSGCTNEIDNPAATNEGIPFAISASAVDVKTSIDGWATSWNAKDAINLFHSNDGGEIVNDNKFEIAEADLATNTFRGTLASAPQGTVTWYALYPYASQIITPGERTSGYTYVGHSKGANQAGNNSTAHLCGTLCPLYAKTSIASSEPVSLTMKHIVSVAEITVTNSEASPLTVSEITIKTDEDIVGSYFIDITGESPVCTPSGDNYVNKTATLNVNGAAALAQGESAKFYIPIKAHTVEAGNSITITVNGYEKSKTLTSDVVFSAGKIKRLGFAYDNAGTEDVKIVTFDFTDPASLGITPPEPKSDGTNITAPIVKEGVTLTTTDGSTATRIWNNNGSYDLRAYKNGSLNFAVAEPYKITKIELTGSALAGLSATTWEGSESSVMFTISSDSKTIRIKTAKVSLSSSDVPPVPQTPEIVVADIAVVPAEGGQKSVNVTVNNPVEGTALSVQSVDGTVVSSATISADVLTYTVSANTVSETRKGSITLAYGSVTKTIEITQAAYVAPGVTWVKVTDASTLKAGDVLIIACSSKAKAAGDISSSVMASVDITVNEDGTITSASGVVELTLGGSADSWTLSNAAGKKLGATAVKKVAWGSRTDTWKITISGGNATIQSTNNDFGRFLYNAGSPRFTTYKSDTSTNMLLPELYRKSGN